MGLRAATGGGGTRMTIGKAVWNQIESNDYRLMRKVHRWPAPRWFRTLMIVATRSGDGWLWYSLGLILLVYGGEHRFEAIGAGLCAAAAGILLFRSLKRTSRRKRPCEIEPHCWAAILPPDKYSFPVGTFDHGICDRDCDRPFLSVPPTLSARSGLADRLFAHHPRDAFSERRAGGLRDRRAAGLHELPHLRAVLKTGNAAQATSGADFGFGVAMADSGIFFPCKRSTIA